jgi:transitional endoplasmic reticulum ATPase
VIAATNRPDIIDAALLRPGRFDKLISIPTPDNDARKEIFKIHTKRKPLAADVSVDDLAKETDGYTGADIAAICNEAVMASIREYIATGNPLDKKHLDKLKIQKKHFDFAMKKVKPMTKKMLEKYTNITETFSQ